MSKDNFSFIDEALKYEPHRIGSHSDDWGGDSDKPCYCTLKPKLVEGFKAAMLEVINVDGAKEYSARKAGDIVATASASSMNGLRERQIKALETLVNSKGDTK